MFSHALNWSKMQCFATGLKLLYFPFWDASTTKKPHTHSVDTHKCITTYTKVSSLSLHHLPTLLVLFLALYFPPLLHRLILYSRQLFAFTVLVASCLCITHCQQVLKPIAFQLPPLFFLLCRFVLLFFVSHLFFSFPPSLSVHILSHALQFLPICFFSVAPLCTPISTSYFLLLLFCPFSAQQSQHLSLFRFIVFTRFSDLFFFSIPLSALSLSYLVYSCFSKHRSYSAFT